MSTFLKKLLFISTFKTLENNGALGYNSLMNLLRFALMAFFLAPSLIKAAIIPEAIYGDDNRVFIEDYTQSLITPLSESVAAIVSEEKITFNLENEMALIATKTLKKSHYVCENVRFANELTAPKCTAFLVGPDLLLTAGHCILGKSSCAESKFIFDYKKNSLIPSEDGVLVPEKNIYSCLEIIKREYNYETQIDYTLLKLDRLVTDRAPLKYRTKGFLRANEGIVTLGHPSGMPLMAAEGKVLKSSNQIFFSTNMDTFSGNSGGPVFNLETGLVEGIMVRGEEDYRLDDLYDCDRPKICSEDGTNCMGEEVTRITNIKELNPNYIQPKELTALPQTSIEEKEPTVIDDDNDGQADDFDWNDFINNSPY